MSDQIMIIMIIAIGRLLRSLIIVDQMSDIRIFIGHESARASAPVGLHQTKDCIPK
jgi:hypothetical protein